ncbi:MAG: hypothetical protein V4508_15855 [Pseudomonadota bacterium]
MTSYANPAVYQCPGCDDFILRQRLKTINFSGTRGWSDGAPTAWWAQSSLMRCDACAAFFWIADLKPVGELPYEPRAVGHLYRFLARWRGDPEGHLRAEKEWLQIPAKWKVARHAGSANFEDIVFVLSKPQGLSRNRLLWLRRRIWWDLNDRFRSEPGAHIPNVPIMAEADERANMLAILGLLEQGEMGPGDMVEKGELLRLLGNFDEAVTVLKAVPPDGYNEVRAGKSEALARSGDACVRELEMAGSAW